jgi:hypothetical protein
MRMTQLFLLGVPALIATLGCNGERGTPGQPAVVAPSITMQPAAQSIIAGQNASFSVTASGTSVSYQWRRSTDGGTNFIDVVGATSAAFALTAVPLADNAHQFRVVVSNSAGSVTSNAASLTVNPIPVLPAFTTQPASITVTSPNAATFSVVATGTPSPTLQWQVSTNSGSSFADIAGATTNINTTPATNVGDSGHQFRVIASNGSGSTTSTVATLTVNPAAPPKAWGTAELIESDNVGDAETPQVSFDANGNALAVWRQFDGTRNNIWANRYTIGTGWGTATLIEMADTGEAYAPQIALDAHGNALAVWYKHDGTHFNIWANRYTVATGWGTAAMIETDNTGDARFPQIAFDASGHALAVWEQSDGTRFNIWSNRYIAGSGWGTATLIETDNAGSASQPQIAFDPSGNALAVWNQFDGVHFNIWSNRYTTGTGWGAAVLIENDNADNAFAPKIAIDAKGDALAVWHQGDGARFNIWSNRYTVSTNHWGIPALIETHNEGNAFVPQIAFDASGNALAVWQQSDGSRTNIWSNRYATGTGWGTAALIENDNKGESVDPHLAFDPSGNALAVWNQYDGSHLSIWANRYLIGTGWGTASLIETDNLGNALGSQIAIDPSGNGLAVWQQSDGSRTNIWANRFQ